MTGRPPALDKVIDRTPEGAPITASDRVIDRIRAGLYRSDACLSAGITRTTLHNWARAGQVARARAAAGAKLTKKEQGYADFLDALEEAESQAELRRVLLVNAAAEGGREITETRIEYETVTVTNDDGTTSRVQMERARTVTTRTAAPQWQAAAWWLERRFPQKWTRRALVEVSGPEGGPLEIDSMPMDDRLDQLVDDVRSMVRGLPRGEIVDAEIVDA